ncbi:hypothetical protein IW262DRAFT_1455414 [Armillaria fumosa]|nr:hypothetical protein IW262DRAFT_1455414 [Armillaria fumosa]
MTTNSPTVPSRFVCPITKAYSPDKPFEAHMFISHRLQPELKMHLEWAWGLNPHQLVIKNVQNCIGYRRDIIRNSLNGDFALVPTMTTLNTMLAYFSLPCDTPRVYHTRTLGVEFIKHRRITFKDAKAAFRYFFVPITPAGEAICDEFLMGEDSEQVEDDYEGAVEPVSGDDVDPETLKQFRVVTSHDSTWPLSTACYWFTHFCTDASDYPPAWFRRRYKGIEFGKDYEDDDRMDVDTTDEEGGEF